MPKLAFRRSAFLLFSLLLLFIPSAKSISAQALPGNPSTSLVISKPTLVSGPRPLTAQQTQAAQSLTSAQVQQYLVKIQPTLAKLRAQIASHQTTVALPNWQDLIRGTGTLPPSHSSTSAPAFNFSNSSGAPLSLHSTASHQAAVSLAAPLPPSCTPGSVGCTKPCPVYGCNGCPPTICFTCPGPNCPVGIVPPDLDQDGLPDAFEGQVADNFTPLYGSSSSESDQFATFGNYVPMTVTALVGTVPPYSYYRVQPLGLATDPSGNQVYALRIDYLTLWNADGGLVGGGAACLYSYVGLDSVVNLLSGHDLDAERSGMLVAAPVVDGGYNPDPTAYKLYTVYTAAHENTFFDQSMYGSFSPPVPAGNHLNLALSLSKHSTYGFNPDYFPITPSWFIDSYFVALDAAYLSGEIDDAEYYLSVLIGNDVFFGCLVERFGAQGGSYANTRTNVGEPAHPINGSGFIQDDSSRALNLTDKLTNPLF